MNAGTGTRDVEHWDAFWRARDKAIEREDAGARDPAPAHFWETFFEREFTGRTRASVLDVACGHGAVTGIAVAAGRSAGIELEARCADYSQAAVPVDEAGGEMSEFLVRAAENIRGGDNYGGQMMENQDLDLDEIFGGRF